MADNKRTDLIACYRSGQIPEAAWQEHLRADPELRRMMNAQETPLADRKIKSIRVWGPSGPHGETEEYDITYNCRWISAITKPGLHCDIPYIEVRNYQYELIAEFCQHNIVGVYYG